jgi:Fe-S-cluster-containing dehydrogenase component
MAEGKCEHGLLIDYEYCTGCYACQVACAQEYKWPKGMGGIRVMECEENLPNSKHYLKFIPVPTELCILCLPRTRQGLKPACVQTCMAACIKYGTLDELLEEMKKKSRQVLWAPRASESVRDS